MVDREQRVAEALAFTFVDFAACDGRAAGDGVPVPRADWNESMVPVAAYLRADPEAAPDAVPYVLTVDAEDRLQRLVVDDKQSLMHKLGKRTLSVQLGNAIDAVPASLSSWSLELSDDGTCMTYTYDPMSYETGVAELLRKIDDSELELKDVFTKQSSLEEIFISLVRAQ